MKSSTKEVRRGSPAKIVDDKGNVFSSITALGKALGIDRHSISDEIKNSGVFQCGKRNYRLVESPEVELEAHGDDKEFIEYMEYKKRTKEMTNDLSFERHAIEFKKTKGGERYAIALFSDAHIEETVTAESVLNKNEYDVEIAKKRILKYFANLAECVKVDEVNDLIFASLGDTISGFIHEELSQCNGLTPVEASKLAQDLIVSGMQHLRESTNLRDIYFVGIVGNHSRITKKIQHANGFKMSYEWWMYNNIRDLCNAHGLNIKFILPESEVAIVDVPCDSRRLLFCHGYQIRSTGTGTVCGIYPSLQRQALKWAKVFQPDRIYMGHFHSCISITSAAVNGSIIGYNSYSLSNGFEYQRPCQYYEVIDTSIGQLLERKIYCD